MTTSVWAIPITHAARGYLAQQKVVAQLRTRDEGLQDEFTKPSQKRHRKNVGGSVDVCAGISNGRIVLWEYLARWGGQAAVDLYKGPILSTLIKKRGVKTSYLLAEDNDPTGYKSSAGMDEKVRLGIKTIPWPRYSPDLMPLDFCLWADIGKRVAAGAPDGKESVEAFKARLRRTALRTPARTVRAAVLAMRPRALKIWECEGTSIPRG